jgi:hypothetical protein
MLPKPLVVARFVLQLSSEALDFIVQCRLPRRKGLLLKRKLIGNLSCPLASDQSLLLCLQERVA